MDPNAVKNLWGTQSQMGSASFDKAASGNKGNQCGRKAREAQI